MMQFSAGIVSVIYAKKVIELDCLDTHYVYLKLHLSNNRPTVAVCTVLDLSSLFEKAYILLGNIILLSSK